MSLADVLPQQVSADTLYDAFVEWAAERGVALYPHQEEAAIELFDERNVVLATPTGSGKSMVAIAAHFAALARGRRTYYTAPIKALVSEKFFELCRIFGASNVGMVTGDGAVNADAPIICCTAEVLANISLRGGAASDVGQVVMDEFHFYADGQRGWAWQVPLLCLPGAQFLLMSATLGDVSKITEDLTRRTGRETALVNNAERPVPLSFGWSLEPLHELLERLVAEDQAPVYVVHFTQASATERANALLSAKLCTREERDAIAEAIGGFRFTAGFGRTLSRLVATAYPASDRSNSTRLALVNRICMNRHNVRSNSPGSRCLPRGQRPSRATYGDTCSIATGRALSMSPGRRRAGFPTELTPAAPSEMFFAHRATGVVASCGNPQTWYGSIGFVGIVKLQSSSDQRGQASA